MAGGPANLPAAAQSIERYPRLTPRPAKAEPPAMPNSPSMLGRYVPPAPDIADGYDRESRYVTVNDGCRIALDILHPAAAGTPPRRPAPHRPSRHPLPPRLAARREQPHRRPLRAGPRRHRARPARHPIRIPPPRHDPHSSGLQLRLARPPRHRRLVRSELHRLLARRTRHRPGHRLDRRSTLGDRQGRHGRHLL